MLARPWTLKGLFNGGCRAVGIGWNAVDVAHAADWDLRPLLQSSEISCRNHTSAASCTASSSPTCQAVGACHSIHSRAGSLADSTLQRPLRTHMHAIVTARTVSGTASPAPAPKASKVKGGKVVGGAPGKHPPNSVGQLRSVEELRASYQRSRLQELYNSTLSRELLLKLNVRSVQELPQIRSVSVAIQARDVVGDKLADKWRLLLPALALEYVTSQPASFVHSPIKYYRKRNAVSAVTVSLTGRDALDFIEKLVYTVLPSQNAFEGILLRALDRDGQLHFTVPKMSNYPDLEELYETFEGLGNMHVTIRMANVRGKPSHSQLLLTGLQVPLFARKKKAGDEDEDAQRGGSDDEDVGVGV